MTTRSPHRHLLESRSCHRLQVPSEEALLCRPFFSSFSYSPGQAALATPTSARKDNAFVKIMMLVGFCCSLKEEMYRSILKVLAFAFKQKKCRSLDSWTARKMKKWMMHDIIFKNLSSHMDHLDDDGLSNGLGLGPRQVNAGEKARCIKMNELMVSSITFTSSSASFSSYPRSCQLPS